MEEEGGGTTTHTCTLIAFTLVCSLSQKIPRTFPCRALAQPRHLSMSCCLPGCMGLTWEEEGSALAAALPRIHRLLLAGVPSWRLTAALSATLFCSEQPHYVPAPLASVGWHGTRLHSTAMHALPSAPSCLLPASSLVLWHFASPGGHGTFWEDAGLQPHAVLLHFKQLSHVHYHLEGRLFHDTVPP